MNPTASKLTQLLGSASLLSLASAVGAQAQQMPVVAQAEEIPETVLITGSLIRGAVAVGVPVTNITTQDFVTTGALTTADLFRSVPSALVTPGPVGTLANNNIGKQTRVNIRNLDPNDGTRSLMMVDGYRFPPQGEADCTIDPSIIPQIALDRIDILVDGASATYGSDAIAGVINIILRRNFDGAITQLRTTSAKGKIEYQASQLWGRTWDGGQITLSYEWQDISGIAGKDARNWQLDFTPWGFEDRTPIRSSLPATLSIGNPAQNPAFGLGIGGANALGRLCSNCYAIPAGSGANFDPSFNGGIGPTKPYSAFTTNWATLSSPTYSGVPNGTQNEFNPYSIAQYDAAQQKNSAVVTIDQRLTKDISFFGEGFYANRRAQYVNPSNLSPSSTNDLSAQVPTFNPYYPTGGAPTNLRVNYNFGMERPSITQASELADRYLFGLNIALPHGWEGKIYYSESFDNTISKVRDANPNAVSAALGWTIGAGIANGTSPAVATWTKPANVPYLNLFCDPRVYTCNSGTTIDYVTGIRSFSSNYWINEKGIQADGPLFALPAGDVKAAIGSSYTSHTFFFSVYDSTSSPSLVVPMPSEAGHKQVWAVFTQVNIPIFGDNFNFPGMRKLDLEGSWRHDQYNDVGGTSNPKVAFNWEVSEYLGLTVRGSWGTSFRAPTFAEEKGLVKNAIAAWNTTLFAQAATINVSCPVSNDPSSIAQQSMAQRLVNPGNGLTGWNGVVSNGAGNGVPCAGAPVGLALLGASGTAINAGFRNYINTSGQELHPETSMNWGLGLEFAPSFLKGLDVQATWYQVKISGALRGFPNPNSTSINDPGLGFAYIVPTDLAGVDPAGCSNNNTPTTCPEFESMVNKLLADPRSPVNPQVATAVLWINDGATFNAGYIKLDGIDFTASYDWDWGSFGAWNVGINGTYYLHQYSANFVGNPNNPAAAVPQDLFHTTLGDLNGVHQYGVESLPRMRYRARLGWSNGPWSVTGFVDYQAHFYHTQNAPPNVNFGCIAPNGVVGGGTYPCAISGYTNIVPSYYTFDLSFGYDTGDTPANDYLKHIGIQLVVQNIMDKHPPFEYRIGTGAGNPTTFDLSKSDQGRTIGLILTKTW